MKVSVKIEKVEVSRAELAKRLGISSRQIARLEKAGTFRRTARRRPVAYDFHESTAAFIAYKAKLAARPAMRAEPPGGEGNARMERDEAMSRFYRSQADALLRDYLPRETVEQIWTLIEAGIRRRFEGWPATAADTIKKRLTAHGGGAGALGILESALRETAYNLFRSLAEIDDVREAGDGATDSMATDPGPDTPRRRDPMMARAEKDFAAAALTNLKTDIQEGRFIKSAEVRRVWAGQCGVIANRLKAMPGTACSPALRAWKHDRRRGLKRQLEREAGSVLTELRKLEYATPAGT